ncbi:MAG: GNAT family N-acetyltransferase [Muribaculaceae bacterium]|nr:GNAT family N-acetyltransferase [Muribaculaceae bacterium]
MEYYIRNARPDDAPFIAATVMGALGPELCEELGGGPDRIPVVRELFTTLAADKDSQYSYTNSFIAVNESDEPLGCVVAYDGALLHPLRLAFAREANRLLGWNVTPQEVENWADEASPDEIYIDSLYVRPEFRKQGIAIALLNHLNSIFITNPKPKGLLCEPENLRALRLYRSIGFEEAGVSHFFNTPMIHLQLKTPFPNIC